MITEKAVSYESLKAEFQEKVKQLQETCQHLETEWMLVEWAPGHLTGQDALVCLVCCKELDKRQSQLSPFNKSR